MFRNRTLQSGVSWSRYPCLSLLVMLTLLLLAAIYWRERAWWLDVAYQTVLMLRDGTVQVQVYRFGAAVVQALPLAAIYMGLPLWAVSWCYSVAFPLVFLLFWWLVVRVFRQPALGLAMALLYTGMVYDGFYWATSELQQGLGFLLVFWAGVLRWFGVQAEAWDAAQGQAKTVLQYPLLVGGLLALGIVALVFYHPMVFVAHGFCWVFFLLTRPPLRRPAYWGLLALLAVALWVKAQYGANYYDAGKMAVFKDNLVRHFPNYFQFPAYRKFAVHCLLYWWGFPVLLLVTLCGLLYYRYARVAALVLLACVAYVVVQALGSPNASYRFYSEVNYYPLLLMVALPFCTLLLPRWQSDRRVFWALAAFFVLRLGLIVAHHQPFTARWQWVQETSRKAARQTDAQRFLLPEADAPMDTLVMTWATPFESLLATASLHPDSAATLLVAPDLEAYPDSVRQSGEMLLNPFQPVPVDELPSGYIRLRKGHYYRLDKNVKIPVNN